MWTPDAAAAQVLIFSRSVRMLNLVQALVTKHGWASELLDGGTPEVRGFQRLGFAHAGLCAVWVAACRSASSGSVGGLLGA